MLVARARKLLKREFEARLAVVDLTVPQIYVLRSLWESDGLPISHLSSLACSDGPTLTSLLDRLEAKDLIVRERDPNDRRVVRIYLRPRGRELKEGVMKAGNEVYSVVRQGLSENEHDQLCRLLAMLCDTLEVSTCATPAGLTPEIAADAQEARPAVRREEA